VRLYRPHGASPRRSRVGGVCPDLVQGPRSQHIMPPGRPPPRCLCLTLPLIFYPLVAKKIEVYPADSQPGVPRDDQLSRVTSDVSFTALPRSRERENAPERCHPSRLRFHPLVHIHNSQFNFSSIKNRTSQAFLALSFCRNTTLDRPCNSSSRSNFHFHFRDDFFHIFLPIGPCVVTIPGYPIRCIPLSPKFTPL
jgi:hypothetical protein